MKNMMKAKFPVSGKMPDKDNGYNTKVPVPASSPTMGKMSQPMMGKLGDGMQSMPGGTEAKKGGAVKTVPSQPTTGKLDRGMTTMGSGIIPGKV